MPPFLPLPIMWQMYSNFQNNLRIFLCKNFRRFFFFLYSFPPPFFFPISHILILNFNWFYLTLVKLCCEKCYIETLVVHECENLVIFLHLMDMVKVIDAVSILFLFLQKMFYFDILLRKVEKKRIYWLTVNKLFLYFIKNQNFFQSVLYNNAKMCCHYV